MNTTTLQSQQPTIIRIKRKRTDEPLDALVVESRSRRKKSRGASGFFQFAETVEQETFWEDPSLTKDLRTRISTLANGRGVPTEIPAESRPPLESPARRYTIVKKPAERKLPAPPIVHTASELRDDAGSDDFAMYDAVLEGAPRDEPPMDDDMAKFLPMLQEYLRVNDEPSNVSSVSAQPQNNEYVWDVFYHRPVITDWAAAANIATVSGLPAIGNNDTDSGSDSAPNEDDEDSNTEDFYRNDYPDEDPDLSDDSDSDSEEYPEVEDEDDERELDDFMASRARR